MSDKPVKKTLHELGLAIAHEGRLEEFYQRGGGYGVWSGLSHTGPGADSEMQYFHKNRRLALEAEYQKLVEEGKE